MAEEMKMTIAKAVGTLLIDKHVKNLTVKDIAEECHITRQTFYYHFEDIPDLFQWILDKQTELLLENVKAQPDLEAGFRYIILFAVNATAVVKKGSRTNYGEELERLLDRQIYLLFERIADSNDVTEKFNRFEWKVRVRYHVSAIRGFLRDWSDEDTRHADEIIHEMYKILTA